MKHYNYSKQHIIHSVNNSLSNLKTGYLDLLLLHRPSPLMDTDIISDAVDELIKQGKIKDFGVSNFKPSHIELLSKNINISWNQIIYKQSVVSCFRNMFSFHIWKLKIFYFKFVN